MADSTRVIFLYGTDEFAIARRIEELQKSMGDGISATMNITHLEARTMSGDDLNNAVNSAPFLASWRLVVLSNPSTRYVTPEARGKFLAFLQKVPPTTLLVMHEFMDIKKDKPGEDEKHWIIKWGRGSGDTIGLERYPLPKAGEMAGWISEETRRQNGQIEPRAAVCLADMVGEDTRVAAQEIAKLLTYVNLGRPITVQDVEHVSVVTAQESIFALVDALGNKNGHEAQRVLHRLLEEADPFELWGMVIRQFRLLLLAREIIEAGGSARQIQDALRLRDFAASKVYKQARQFSMPALEAIYHRLLEIDEGAKTSQVTLELALDMFIVEIVRQP